jgi:Prp8 binding protein
VLWRTYGDCENYGVLNGHRGAILDLQWSRDGDILFSASADMHLASWDLTTGQRIRRYIGHEEIINAMDISRRGEELLLSGSDDGTIGIWDPRTKHAVDYIETDFPITAVAMSEAGNEIYSGGIDNDIRVWDIRKKALVHSMLGHQDTITSLRVSPDGQQLLSYAMDSTARTWDIRPFAPAERHIRTFDGAPLGLEKNLIRGSWDSDGKKIAVGAGDGTVVIWGSDSGKLLYKLPGHKGTVNCAEFAPGSAPISRLPLLRWHAGRISNRAVSSLRLFRPYHVAGRIKMIESRRGFSGPCKLSLGVPGRSDNSSSTPGAIGSEQRRQESMYPSRDLSILRRPLRQSLVRRSLVLVRIFVHVEMAALEHGKTIRINRRN